MQRLDSEVDDSHTVDFDGAAIGRCGGSVVLGGEDGDARALSKAFTVNFLSAPLHAHKSNF